ncbi:MAG: cupin domain-containing protein [Candidatus Eiseniibacteriota bacterium]
MAGRDRKPRMTAVPGHPFIFHNIYYAFYGSGRRGGFGVPAILPPRPLSTSLYVAVVHAKASAMWRLTIYDVVSDRAARIDAPGRRYLHAADDVAWLCEAAPADVALLDPSLASPVLSKTVRVTVVDAPLFRVDRIDLEAGARTPRHFHRGPGIRRLLFGRVRVEIGAETIEVGPGGAWFEPGDAPVVGSNAAAGPSAFLRVSLLPADLLGGKSSFVPASDAEAGKPRAVAQRLLHEAVVF